MPDFAPNFTPRYRVTYRVHSRTHRMIWRAPTDRTIADVGDYSSKWTLWQSIVAPAIYEDFETLSADWAEVDSDIFLPVGTPSFTTGGASTTGRSRQQSSLAISFPGRTTAGLRAIFFLYGTAVESLIEGDTSDDFKITATESSEISDAVDQLNDPDIQLVGNDGNLVVWYPYVNIKFNDHFVKKLRQGS